MDGRRKTKRKREQNLTIIMGEGERNPEIFLTCKIENEKKNKNMFRNFRKEEEKQTEKKKKRQTHHTRKEKMGGRKPNEIYEHDLVLLSINNRIQLNTADMRQFLMSIELVIR